jgi:hypothetical protein
MKREKFCELGSATISKVFEKIHRIFAKISKLRPQFLLYTDLLIAVFIFAM